MKFNDLFKLTMHCMLHYSRNLLRCICGSIHALNAHLLYILHNWELQNMY